MPTHKKHTPEIKRLKRQLLRERTNSRNGSDWLNAFLQVEDFMMEHKLWGFADITSNNPADTLINAINRLVTQRDALLVSHLDNDSKEKEYIRVLTWLSNNNGAHPANIKSVALEGLNINQKVRTLKNPADLIKLELLREIQADIIANSEGEAIEYIQREIESLAANDVTEKLPSIHEVLESRIEDKSELLYQKVVDWCETTKGDLLPPAHAINVFEAACKELNLDVQDLHIMKTVTMRILNERVHAHIAHQLAHHLYLKPMISQSEVLDLNSGTGI